MTIAPDSSDKFSGGLIQNLNSDAFGFFKGSKITLRAFIHNTTNHTVNLVIWTDTNGFGVGTGVPAGTDGVSTITAYSMPSNGTRGDINIRAYTDNATISGVKYKMEDGDID